jgi:hypothetical protein
LFKDSNTHFHPETEATTDSGYQGLHDFHANSQVTKKKPKGKPLSKEDKKYNRELARKRIPNEHVIRFVKRFRILAGTYRNRRRRFALRFTLIAGIYNWQLKS